MSAAADALMGIFGFNRVESEMKTVEETRRELFEAWHAGVAAQKGLSDELQSSFTWVATKELMLCAFNAALDAVLIELPCDRSLSASDDPWYVVGICRDAIESTNLGLKIL